MRLLSTLVVFLLGLTVVFGQETRTFQVVLDTNGDLEGGCEFELASGETVTGGELLGTVTVTLGDSPTVSNVVWERCDGGTFSSGVFTAGNWPVGSNVGVDASDVIEFGLPSSFLGVTQQVQVLGQAEGDGSYDIVPDTGWFTFSLPEFVPTLQTWGLIFLIAALIGCALWYSRKGRLSQAATTASLVLVAAIILAPTVIIRLDGNVDDWAGIDPLGLDPAGDTTSTRVLGGMSDPTVDILAFYAAQGSSDVYFRFDVAELENRPPVANDDVATTMEDTPVTFDVLANDTEPDGEAIAVTAVSTPANGSVVIEADDQLTYTPNADFHGMDTFTYTVTDDFGSSSQGNVTVTVTPVNDAPLAQDGVASTDEDTPVVITLQGVDVDGDTLTFSVVTAPTNGSLSAISSTGNTTATVTYTPTMNVKGSDSFTFRVNDGTVDSAAATVNITVGATADGPTANDDAQTTDEDNAVVIDALANDTDPDTGDVLEVLSTTNPANGTVSILMDGTLEYEPNADFNGSDSFDYVVRDTFGLTDTATVNITVNPVNDPPIAVDDAAIVADMVAFNFSVNGNDFDPDGDMLTVISITANPSEGMVVIEADSTVTYTPNAGHSGSDSFEYEIQDPDGSSSTATVSLTVVDPGGDTTPLASDDAVITNENTTVVINVLGNDNDLGDGPLFIFDMTQPSNGSVALLADNQIEYVPTPGFAGADSFTYSVSNQSNETDTATVSITVTNTNDAPAALNDLAQTEVDTPVVVSVLNNDNDIDAGATLTVVVAGDGVNGTTSINGGSTVTYTPAAGFEGTDSFSYTIEDENGSSDSALVTVEVVAAGTGSIAVADTLELDEDGSFTFDPTANDVPGATLLSVTQGSLGSVTDNGNGTVTYAANPDEFGSDTFTYEVSAPGRGSSTTGMVSVTVLPVREPPLGNSDTATTDEDVPVNIDVLANDRDPDNGTLTVIRVTPSPHGTTVIEADNTITFTPAPEYVGTARFLYIVENSDGFRRAAFVSVTVNAVNDAPVANDDMSSTAEDMAVDIDVLANDTDVENTIDATTVTIVTNPTNGGAVVNPVTGVVTYTPNMDYVGFDTFTYTVADDGSPTSTVETSNEATVTIEVGGVPDTVADNETTLEDTPVDIDVLANDGGPGDVLDPATVMVTSGPSDGMTSVNPVDGVVTYTPDADFFGTDSFTYTVEDTNGTGSMDTTVTVTVTGVNDVPSFTVGGNETVLEDAGAQNVMNWATAIDAGANESGQVLTFNVVNNTDAALFDAGPAIDAAGNLTYTPAADANGTATITIELMDDGGTANGGVDTSAQETFDITITAVNDAPSFTDGGDRTVNEDAGAQTVSAWATAILAGPADESGQMLTFNITNNTNAALFDVAPAIDATSGDLTFTPAAASTGSATITVELMDDGGTADGGADTSAAVMFDINVDSVNDEPSFTAGADQTVNEDAGAQTVMGWATAIDPGPGEGGQVLTFNVTANTNMALFAAGPAIDATTGNLTYTPAADANGTATITIELMDDGGTANGGDDTSPTQSFDITVNAVNDVPSFTAGGNQTVLEDAGAQTVNSWATALSTGPADESGQVLSFNIAGNTNAALFAAGPAIDASGNLTYTPAADANGTATITVELMDDGGTANGGVDTSAGQMFDITITAVNDVPSFTAGADQNYMGAATAQTVMGWAIAISAGAANESGQVLTFNITGNTNMALFDVQPAVNGATGDLTFTPANGASGTATITLTLSDDGGTANGGVDTSAAQMFDITVAALNQEPSFTAGMDQTVLEDAGAQTVPGWATMIDDGDGGSQMLTFNIAGNTNAALFAAGPAIDATTGDLTFTPAADANGTATITVELMDDGGTVGGGDDTSAAAMFDINVTEVNDVPSFTAGMDQTVAEDAGAQTVMNWATGISAGAANESGQMLTFNVVNDNNALFSAQPAIDAMGNLTFTSALNQFGSATVTVSLSDDGGTANGGVDTTGDQMFTITITSVADAPVAADDTTFDTAGNVALYVDVAAPVFPHFRVTTTGTNGLLDNDSDPVEGGAISVTAINGMAGDVGMATTTGGGGTLTVTAGGTMIYIPPAGVRNTTDSFTYTITNTAGASDTGTVTIEISNEIAWFIDDTAGGGGDGTSATPFNDIAGYETARGGGDVQAGDILFVHRGNTGVTALDGTITLLDNMSLVGEGFGLSLTNPNTAMAEDLVTAGTRPEINVTAGGSNAIEAADNVTVRGLDIVGATNAGIHLNNVTGVNVTDVDLSNVNIGLNASGADIGVTLTNFDISSATTDGISVDAVTNSLNFTLTGDGSSASALSNIGGNGISFTNIACDSTVALNNSGGNGVTLDMITGTGVNLDFDSGTSTVTLNNTTVTNSMQGAAIDNGGTSDVAYTVNGSSFGSTGAAFTLDNAAAGSTAELAIVNVGINSSGGDGLMVSNTGSGTLTVTGLTFSSVAANGTAVAISEATFDADTATGGIQQVSGGNLTLGTMGAPIGGNGLDISNSTGDLAFGTLNVVNSNGDGVAVSSLSTIDFTTTGGTIQSTGGRAVDLRVANVAAVFDSVTATDSTGTDGMFLNNLTGSFEVTGATTVSNTGAGDGIEIINSTATFTFDDLSLTLANGNGLSHNNSATAIGSLTVAPTTSATVSATGGIGLLLNNVNTSATFNAISSANSGSNGLSLTDNTGTLTINGGSITNPTAAAVDMTGGTSTFTYDGSITTNAGRTVDIDNVDGGSVNFGGTHTATAPSAGALINGSNTTVNFNGAVTLGTAGSNLTVTALTIQGANTGTVDFGGNTEINTNGATGANITGGGTIHINGGTNTIATTTGTAIIVDGATIGGNGVTEGLVFESIDVTGSGTNGIFLNDTGMGRFVITGDGSTAGSGGTLTNITQRGLSATNADNISLSYMDFTNATTGDASDASATCGATGIASCFAPIYLNGCSNVMLDNLDIDGSTENGINGVSVNGLTLSNSNVLNIGNSVAGEESAFIFHGLTGTVNISNSDIGLAEFRAARILNTSAGTLNLTITNSTFRDTQDATTVNNAGQDGLEMVFRSSAVGNIDISGSSFLRCRTSGLQILAENTADLSVDVTTSTFNHGTDIGKSVEIAGGDTATIDFNVDNNVLLDSNAGDAVIIAALDSASVEGRVTNNGNIVQQGIGTNAIRIRKEDQGSVIVDVSDNSITTTGGQVNSGIQVISGPPNLGSPCGTTCTERIDATIDNNTINGSFALGGVYVDVGTTHTICTNITNNSVTVAAFEFHFSQITNNANSNFLMEGLTGTVENTWTVNGNSGTDFNVFNFGPFSDGTCTTPSNPAP